jgi:hypothetical protein
MGNKLQNMQNTRRFVLTGAWTDVDAEVVVLVRMYGSEEESETWMQVWWWWWRWVLRDPAEVPKKKGDGKTASSVDARTCFPAELASSRGMHPCSESYCKIIRPSWWLMRGFTPSCLATMIDGEQRCRADDSSYRNDETRSKHGSFSVVGRTTSVFSDFRGIPTGQDGLGDTSMMHR